MSEPLIAIVNIQPGSPTLDHPIQRDAEGRAILQPGEMFQIIDDEGSTLLTPEQYYAMEKARALMRDYDART